MDGRYNWATPLPHTTAAAFVLLKPPQHYNALYYNGPKMRATAFCLCLNFVSSIYLLSFTVLFSVLCLENCKTLCILTAPPRPGVQQLQLNRSGDKCLVGCSAPGPAPAPVTASLAIKLFPQGDTLVTVEWPVRRYTPAVLVQVTHHSQDIHCDDDNKTDHRQVILSILGRKPHRVLRPGQDQAPAVGVQQ